MNDFEFILNKGSYRFIYIPKGVCIRKIVVDVDMNMKILNIEFTGGCPGQAKSLNSLCKGEDVKTVAEKLSSVKCGNKKSSCGAELSKALLKGIEYINNKRE